MSFRVTYATMSADDDALHEAYDRGIETARSWLGEDHGMIVNGEHRRGIAGRSTKNAPRSTATSSSDASRPRHPKTCTTPSPQHTPPLRHGPRRRGRNGSRSSNGAPTRSPRTAASSRR